VTICVQLQHKFYNYSLHLPAHFLLENFLKMNFVMPQHSWSNFAFIKFFNATVVALAWNNFKNCFVPLIKKLLCMRLCTLYRVLVFFTVCHFFWSTKVCTMSPALLGVSLTYNQVHSKWPSQECCKNVTCHFMTMLKIMKSRDNNIYRVVQKKPHKVNDTIILQPYVTVMWFSAKCFEKNFLRD